MRTASLLWATFVIALSVTNGVAQRSEVAEAAAKERSLECVRSQLNLPHDHFLRATRREDLEDDLFAAQVKMRGQIRKAAFFFEVTETGYEVLSPEEAILHSSVDGVGRWYVAVDRTSGDCYGLGGFDQPEQAFNRLAENARVFLASDASAQQWAGFYLRTTLGNSQGVFLTRQSDLQRQVEDIAEAYSGSRKRPFSAKQWLQGLKQSGVEPIIGMQVVQAKDGFQVRVDAVATSSERQAVLRRLRFDVSSRGKVTGQSILQLFPRLQGSR